MTDQLQHQKSSHAPEKPKNKKEKVPELSEEDQALKDNLTNWVEATKSDNLKDKEEAIHKIFHEVISATSSMTSIPKPMKFLVALYPTLVEEYDKTPESNTKQFFADLLALLSGTLAEPYEQQSYKYLKQGTGGDFLQWGHEFQLQLAGDISKIYGQRLDSKEDSADLVELSRKLVKYFLNSNSEIDAIDLLLEIDHLEMAMEYIDKDNIRKIYDYLLASSPFAADQDEYQAILRTAYQFCMRVEEHFLAMRAAMKLDDQSLVEEAFRAVQDPLMKKQMAFSLGRQRLIVETDDQELTDTMYNTRISEFFMKLMKDLDIEKPKHPETDVFKSKNDEKIESEKHNLAMTYANAFVNLGSSKDALLTGPNSTADPWLSHLKKDSMMAGAASLGMIDLWNVEESTSKLSDYFDLQDGWCKAGACIGIGLANTGVWSEIDPAKAILEENIASKDASTRLGSAIGMGLAYAGTAREEFRDLLSPLITDLGIGPDTAGFASLSLGLIFVSKCDSEVIETILTSMMERPESELSQVSSRFFAVALALTCLGQQEKADTTIEALASIEHPIGRFAEVCVESAAYIGSGNVLKVQELIKRAMAHEPEDKSLPQAAAVIGAAFVAFSEKIGQEMSARLLNHVLQYCELGVKRAVPIALGVLNISNPSVTATDLLSKLAHDEDKEMSMRAIFSLGLIGLGTNNARIGGLVKGLMGYYKSDPGHVYMTKIALGLLSAGKGLVTANPFYSDQFLFSKVSMASLFIIANCLLDAETVIFEKFHYCLFYLVPSLYPRWLFTLDENLENFPVTVRVGQAVDTVAQVGNPRTITGFQTHTSPIVFSYGDRAEIGTEEYIPVGKNIILENFIILKKDPEYEKNKEANPRKKTSASIYF